MEIYRWKNLISRKPYIIQELGIVYQGHLGWIFPIKNNKISSDGVEFLKQEGFSDNKIKNINRRLKDVRPD